MDAETAQTIALRALAWMVADETICPAFLGATGTSAGDLRTGAADPVFLASVLEFLTTNDAWIIAFCDDCGLPYDAPLRARYGLPGAEQVHWT